MGSQDRINPWTTKDMGDQSECTSILTCSNPTKAPSMYLADSRGAGTIMLDSRNWPTWVEPDEDNRIFLQDSKEGSVGLPLAVGGLQDLAQFEPYSPCSREEPSGSDGWRAKW